MLKVFTHAAMLPALAALAMLGAAVAAAGELPLWELGVGAFPSSYPAYRGSSEQKYYVLPFPYLVYRGNVLKIDREGVRAQLFESERVTFNVSVSGAIPSKSDSHSAREGMPDLDGAFEIGPAMDILVASPTPRETVKIRLPVRAVISTNLRRWGEEGWVFNPQVDLDYEGGRSGWNVGLAIGPIFATRKYHAYYYDVAPEFATATRPAYGSSAGYSGSMALVSFSRRFSHVWVGGFMRYDYLGGAAFGDSPLVETNHSLMGGVAVAWVFATSGTMVSRQGGERPKPVYLTE